MAKYLLYISTIALAGLMATEGACRHGRVER